MGSKNNLLVVLLASETIVWIVFGDYFQIFDIALCAVKPKRQCFKYRNAVDESYWIQLTFWQTKPKTML